MSSTDAGAMLDAWRERGNHHHDPVRFRFMEALARRAATHRGDARRILHDKLTRLLAAYGEDLDKRVPCPDTAANPPAQPDRDALSALVDIMGRQAPAHDVETLNYFRSIWSRLSAERRLTQSLAKLPENAGPLNSHQLVHRSLTLMHELSPEYLHRFMAYVDTLLWIDQANTGSALAGADSPRAESPRKTARARSG
ncbi:MAG: DUF2894 domain-containing protein [Variovorax sp.]